MAEIIQLSDRRPFVTVERVRLDGAPAVVLMLREADGETLVWDDRSSAQSVDEAVMAWRADGIAVVDLRCAGRC